MQLAGKAMIRVCMVNLPWRSVPFRCRVLFWSVSVWAGCMCYMWGVISKGKFSSLPISPRKKTFLKTKVAPDVFTAASRTKFHLKKQKTNETWDNSEWENKANTTTEEVMLCSTFYLASWRIALRVDFHLLWIAGTSVWSGRDLGFERKVCNIVLRAQKCLVLT